MPSYVVAAVDEIPPGERKLVEVAGRSVGVFNVGGAYYALLNRCPHQAGPLCRGLLHAFIESTVPGEYRYTRKGEILRCPWHGWEFDVKTGQSWFDPARVRVRAYEASVQPGSAIATGGMQPGPYVAETYPVSVEERYVVVHIPAAREARA